MAVYHPLTIQVGDNTYVGEWATEGQTVWVHSPVGEKSKTLTFWDKPISAAELLLFDLLKDSGQL